ncbi:MAG: flavin reductase family protein [Cytophagales bacterium]|nr:flavin reductase family protein [Cytophagales bacterium]
MHGLLLSAVAPRPICFASTIDAEGNVNLSPFSFFNVFSANPPIMVFSPARRGRDNTTKHSFDNVKEVPEVVINIVNYSIVEQMSLSSTEYAKGVNEFVKSGLTEVPSDLVKPPRVGESPISFECKVDDVIELGQNGGAGNLVISRVVKIHVDKQYLDSNSKLDTVKLDLVARLGGNWYGRMIPEALFEVPKPLAKKGIGVDALPEHVRMSDVLTGNELGRLGNLESLPSAEAIDKISKLPEVAALTELDPTKEQLKAIHGLASDWLADGKVEEALALILAF